MELFHDDKSCLRHIVQRRWPDGFSCPHCASRRHSKVKDRDVFQCRDCRRMTSITAGTVFHSHKLPLRTWFIAVYLVTTFKGGISAAELGRQIGVSYKSAWTIHRKIDSGLLEVERRTVLMGDVEADESFLGPVSRGKPGRASTKSVVAIKAERRETGRKGRRAMGRARLDVIPDASIASIREDLARSVEPGSTLHTDGWPSYTKAAKESGLDYVGQVQGAPERGHEVLPLPHALAANAKRQLEGVHFGVSGKHLALYLGGFAWRLNRRGSRPRLAELGLKWTIRGHPVTRSQLFAANGQ
jgi:transposase-like protein